MTDLKTYYPIFLVLLVMGCMEQKERTPEIPLKENTTHLHDLTLGPFYHGVASGDPYQESVVIWTRVTPLSMTDEISVEWEIALDADFTNQVNSGVLLTNPSKDYTVKAIIDGLLANTTYYYRFKALDSYSITGTTKTLPSDDGPVNLAVVSCSNVEFGYFNAYAAICQEEINAVIHLGDYLYEYGPGTYGDTSFHRKNIPPHEIISLQDYRDRYSQYRLDPDLRRLHAHAPFINVWDDHEITNNAYQSGAENHQPDEGDYEERKAIAKQTYYEWLPIREGDTHYRKFRFGSTMELFMLDERLAGRTMQADSITDPRRFEEDQKLLGDMQMNWLTEGLQSSTSTWKVIGNQVIFSYSDWGYEGFSQNMDAWDGYPNDQKTLSDAVVTNDIDNLVFITGDTHTAWAFEATSDPFKTYDPLTGAGAIGVELGVTSITSANSDERFPTDLVKAHEGKIANSPINPHLKYINMRDHGYLLLSISQDHIRADYKIVSTLKEKGFTISTDKSYRVNEGTTQLIEQ